MPTVVICDGMRHSFVANSISSTTCCLFLFPDMSSTCLTSIFELMCSTSLSFISSERTAFRTSFWDSFLTCNRNGNWIYCCIQCHRVGHFQWVHGCNGFLVDQSNAMKRDWNNATHQVWQKQCKQNTRCFGHSAVTTWHGFVHLEKKQLTPKQLHWNNPHRICRRA